MDEEQVGVDLPNEDLTLHFRTIEMAMSDQDSINSRGRSDEADASHELETQQAEDNCRFLFFNLLRSSDDKNESLYLIEGKQRISIFTNSQIAR